MNMPARTHFPCDEVVVYAHRVDDVTNDDRAEMAMPLLEAFHRFYYFHPSGEPLAAVMADLIGGLGHSFDRLDDDQRDGHDTFWSVLERAHNYYEEEVGDESVHDEPIDNEEEPTDGD